MIYFCIALQVDDIPPSVSRSGKPIDLFASGPISSIGYNAPTLAAIVHRGIRLKKVTTKRTQTSPSVAASALAQAFKVYFQFLYQLHSYVCCTYSQISLPVSANQRIGKDQSKGADAPQSSQQKRKGAKGTRAQAKCQKVATPPPPVSPILVESSPSSPEAQTQQAPSLPPVQEVPQVEEPQPEEPQPEIPQPEVISADVQEQTIDPAGSIIASVVSSIQTSIAPPQGNTLFIILLLSMNLFFLLYNFC